MDDLLFIKSDFCLNQDGCDSERSDEHGSCVQSWRPSSRHEVRFLGRLRGRQDSGVPDAGTRLNHRRTFQSRRQRDPCVEEVPDGRLDWHSGHQSTAVDARDAESAVLTVALEKFFAVQTIVFLKILCISCLYYIFCVRRSRREMYSGHARLCVCPSLHSQTTAWTQM